MIVFHRPGGAADIANTLLRGRRVAACVCMFSLLVGRLAAADGAAIPAVEPPPGLCICVGTTDGEREIRIARHGRTVVQGLALSDESRQTAIRRIASAKLNGLISIERVASFESLPHAGNIANLVVADLDVLGSSAPTTEELVRVVAPRGTLLTRIAGEWRRTTKPVPDDVDEWPQWDYSEAGNPVSRDQRVGPTNALRWLAGTTTTDAAGNKVGLRIANGRVFYINIDYDPDRVWKFKGAEANDVVARDAFNGALLWKRSIDGVPGGGDQPPRFALTADGDRVYCFPEQGEPLEALDAATGKTLVRFEDGPPLPMVTGWDKWKDPISKIHFVVRVFDGAVLQTFAHEAYLSDAQTGKRIWKWSGSPNAPIGWAVVGGGKVFLALAGKPLGKHRASHVTPLGKIIALDAATGKPVWESDALDGRGMFRMIFHKDSVIVPTFPADAKGYGGAHTVTRFSASEGAVVWSTDDDPHDARGHYTIVLSRDDEVIVGQQTGFGVEFATGNFTKRYGWGQSDNSCADLKCVPGYTFYGLTFISDDGDRVTRGQSRAICDVGSFPAYGLLYNSPLGCLCAEYLNGYMALSPEPLGEPTSNAERLVAGHVTAAAEPTGVAWPKADEWPMYLANPRRGASAADAAPDEAQTVWRTKVASWPKAAIVRDWQENERIVGLLTAPTIAAGRVFVAAPDAHQLHAIDAATGECSWTFTAGARIDSPPTIYSARDESLCLFGCRDGWVYCLRASDGALVWKFLAGRREKWIGSQSQFESPWPVHGSVMMDDGAVLVTAGRQSALDGGIYVWKLRPHDGHILWGSHVWTDPDRTPPPNMESKHTRNRRTNDLLVHNGRQACLWITPLEKDYASGELVDIDHQVVQARAMRYSVASQSELREVVEATWIWSASCNGLLSRRMHGVGRHDGAGVNYGDLNATKICLAGKSLFALNARKSRDYGGGLICVDLAADGRLPEAPRWKAHGPRYGATDAMIVAGNRICVSLYQPGEEAKSCIMLYDTRDGGAQGELLLPARVIKDGLAAAAGKVYASLVDGSVVCLGK